MMPMISAWGVSKSPPVNQPLEKEKRKNRIIKQVVDHLHGSHGRSHGNIRLVQSHIFSQQKHYEEDSSGSSSSLPNTIEVCGKRRASIARQIEALSCQGVTLHSVVEIGAVVTINKAGQVIHLLVTEHLGGEQIEIVDDPIETLNLVNADAPIVASIADLSRGGQGEFRGQSIEVVEVF